MRKVVRSKTRKCKGRWAFPWDKNKPKVVGGISYSKRNNPQSSGGISYKPVQRKTSNVNRFVKPKDGSGISASGISYKPYISEEEKEREKQQQLALKQAENIRKQEEKEREKDLKDRERVGKLIQKVQQQEATRRYNIQQLQRQTDTLRAQAQRDMAKYRASKAKKLARTELPVIGELAKAYYGKINPPKRRIAPKRSYRRYEYDYD